MMERVRQWDNNTNLKHKGSHKYGLEQCKTGVSGVKVHELAHSKEADSKEVLIFVTVSTFESDWLVLENENQTGRFNNQHLSFVQKIKIKTDYPIADCHLEHVYSEMNRRDHLIAYLIDIFGHLYTFNLTHYFDFHKKVTMMQQPIRYTLLHQPTSHHLLNDCTKMHHQLPLLLTKNQHLITSVNLGGRLKVYDMNKAKANDSSWISNTMLVEPEYYQFKQVCLAATANNRSKFGHLVVVVLNNKQPPYPFVNCTTVTQYKLRAIQLEAFYTQNQDETSQLTFVEFDTQTNLVVTSSFNQEIQLYQLKKSKEGSMFHYCQKIFKFAPQGLPQKPQHFIESISARKGYLAIAYSTEYILFDLEDKNIKRRGKGKKDVSQIQKLKWMRIIDRHHVFLAFLLIKGYNHQNQAQSKLGKPNIHFKTQDTTKNSSR